jgi:hypothetical protein
MDGNDYARKFVRDTVRATIMKQSARDKQSSVGPSDLGDPCDLCLASKMARHGPLTVGGSRNTGFSLKAWIGTAVHEKLERDLELPEEFAVKEEKIHIATLADYGEIVGHVDVQFTPVFTAVDYKTCDMDGPYGLKKIKLDGPPLKHVRQIMTYGYGLRKAGRDIRYVCLVYIPRDNNNPDNIYEVSAEYDEQIALDTLARAESIWAQLQAGESTFSSAPKCFVCEMTLFRMLP